MTKRRISNLLFWVFTLLVISCASIVAVRRSVDGDFWIYSAFLEELYARPFRPSHPLTNLAPIGIPYWPYLMIVRSFGTFLGVPAETALLWMGVPNALFLLISLRRFIRGWDSDDAAVIPILMSMIFLWNPFNTWFHSNFQNYLVFAVGLCFPATFALALSLCAFERLRAFFAGGLSAAPAFAITLMFSVLSILTLPITGGFCLIGICAMACAQQRSAREFIYAGALCTLVLIVASWWPMYPLFSEMREVGLLYRGGGRVLFEDVFARLGPPLIVALPLFATDIWVKRDRFLLFLFLGTLAVYAYGGATNNWNLGRYAAFAAISAQIRFGLALHRFESNWLSKRFPFLVTTSLVLCFSYWLLSGSAFLRANSCREVQSCVNAASKKDLVMADPFLSLCFVSKGIHVVVADREFYFPGVFHERTGDVETFFAPETSSSAKEALVRKYGVTAILRASSNQRPTYETAPSCPTRLIQSCGDFELVGSCDVTN